jgi:hypothetical protein
MIDHARILVLVDAKNCKPSNRDTPNHSIEMRSLLTAQIIDGSSLFSVGYSA